MYLQFENLSKPDQVPKGAGTLKIYIYIGKADFLGGQFFFYFRNFAASMGYF